jgi:hypothetical protein
MNMRKKLATVVCVLVAAGLSATAALAGEVVGPPGTAPDLSTAAPFHSQSICSYNGLNDFQPNQGQETYIVQTPHNQGIPGQPGAGPAAQQVGTGSPGSPTCGGGSNFRTA